MARSGSLTGWWAGTLPPLPGDEGSPVGALWRRIVRKTDMDSTATQGCACAGAGGGAMVRRSTVDRSPQSGVYGGGYEAEVEHPEPRATGQAKPHRQKRSLRW